MCIKDEAIERMTVVLEGLQVDGELLSDLQEQLATWRSEKDKLTLGGRAHESWAASGIAEARGHIRHLKERIREVVRRITELEGSLAEAAALLLASREIDRAAA